MAKPTDTDTYCWKPDQVEAIINYCHESPDLTWLGQVLLALACTGLRISELAALRWEDVDLENNTIVMRDESRRARKRRRRKSRETKNSRSRSFPINEEFRVVLEHMMGSGRGVIFQGPRGGRLKPDTVRRILVRDVLENLKDQFSTPEDEIGFIDGRLHSFRHYFCSTCANAGVQEQVVMRWLGHRSSKMVKHYYHLHDDEAQRQMKRLNFVSA